MKAMDRREFLGWETAFLPSIVDWLWSRKEEMALMLVVLPTAQAGRQLRQALAEKGACLAPTVVTPGYFLQKEISAAGKLELRCAWIEVLRKEAADAQMLFPIEPEERSFSWAAGVAKELEAVRELLADEGKSFAEVAVVTSETGRWGDLEKLEERMLLKLAQWGLADPLKLRAEAVENFVLPSDLQQLILVGTADPPPLAVRAWQSIEDKGAPVKVLVNAPEKESKGFDSWGGVVGSDYWKTRSCPVPLDQLHLTPGPLELANTVKDLVSGYASDKVSIGLCDPDYAAAIQTSLAAGGWQAWNPEGKAAGGSMVGLLRELASLLELSDRWEVASRVLRNPLLSQIINKPESREALERLDALETQFLPNGMKRVRDLCDWKRRANLDDQGWQVLEEMLAWCSKWVSQFEASCGEALVEWVAQMRELEISDGMEGSLYDRILELASEIGRLEQRHAVTGANALTMVVGELNGMRSAAGRDEAVIDLSGWLELAFEKPGLMVLAGFHEGCVPDGSLDHGFLPDAVRSLLKMRNADSKLARDSYLLNALAASRELRVVVAKVSVNGEPRKPSRLLLQDSKTELAARVQHLFGSVDRDGAQLPGWGRGSWHLEFDEPLKPYLNGDRELSPTAIQNYLKCPFRFYLKRNLKWARYEANKKEMNRMEFGNICHSALEKLGNELSNSEDENEIKQFLDNSLDEAITQFGKDLSLPLLLQRDAARARLRRFAELEVQSRRDGWRTKYTELQVGGSGEPWSVEGQAMVMKVDRIDHHPDLGWRVIDYKTSKNPTSPSKAHLSSVSDGQQTYGSMIEIRRKAYGWSNLQLPLYAAFVMDWLKLDQLPGIGYGNLPASLGGVDFVMWENYSTELHQSAMSWTTGVITAIRHQLFWPPSEFATDQQRSDEFHELAPDGLANAVSGGMIDQMKVIAESWEGTDKV